MKTPISRFTVSGNSMFPTLRQGQDILSFNWAYLGRKPKVGDIVVVRVKSEKVVPAVTIRQTGGGRGKVIREIVKRVQKTHGRRVFVIGDNPKESTDSRDFGFINKDQIVGKVIYSSS